MATLGAAADYLVVREATQEDHLEDIKAADLLEDHLEDPMEDLMAEDHPEEIHITGVQETHQEGILIQEDHLHHHHHLHLPHLDMEGRRQEEEDLPATRPSLASRTTKSTRMWPTSPSGWLTLPMQCGHRE